MDDRALWDDETRTILTRAAEVYRTWRRELRTARVSRLTVERPDADAVQADLVDEWTGSTRTVALRTDGLELPVEARGDGGAAELHPDGMNGSACSMGVFDRERGIRDRACTSVQ